MKSHCTRMVWLCLLAGAGIFLVSCATPKLPATSPDPSDPIRFHTWEDYYERGRRRMGADRFQDAREDFETCLGIRSGARRRNDEDTWRVRTHGMHMFDGYFPNRELGICLYHQGDTKRALTFLIRSMSQTPTERAEHFINQVNAHDLAHLKPAPPQIVLNPPGPVRTRDESYLVKGLATGSGRISGVCINGRPLLKQVAEPEHSFAMSVPLHAGENRIEVVAEDLKGQSAQATLVVFADRSPPHVAILDVDERAGERRVTVACGDDDQLAALTFNQTSQPLQVSASRTVATLAIHPGASASLTALDRAGNELTADLWKLSEGLIGPAESAAAAAADGSEGAVPVDSPPDGPAIHIQHERDTYLVHKTFFYLDGEVTSSHGVDRLVLNGEDVLDRIPPGTRRIRFSSYVDLELGTNTLTLVAKDQHGNRRAKRVAVVRRPPEYVKKSYRLGASVSPLYASHSVSEGRAWQTRIAEKFIQEATPRFNLLSVEPEDVDAVLAELNLQARDLIDPRARIDYSTFTAADVLFNGLVVHHREGIELRFHLVDAETGIRHGYVDVYIDADDPDPDLRLDGLLTKIERHYPVLSGRVLSSSGVSIRLDSGEQSGLNSWARFLVVEPGPDGSMAHGTLLMQDGHTVELQITDLLAREAVAEVVKHRNARGISRGDFYYAR